MHTKKIGFLLFRNWAQNQSQNLGMDGVYFYRDWEKKCFPLMISVDFWPAAGGIRFWDIYGILKIKKSFWGIFEEV